MINNILKKIEKANDVQEVKLEKHEVELASIADLQNSFKKADSAVDTATTFSIKIGDAINLWNKTFSSLKTEMFLAQKNILEGYKLISEINKQAKELGISEIPEVNKIEVYLSDLEKKISAIKASVNDSKNKINTVF